MIPSLLQAVSDLSGDSTGDTEKWDISSTLSTMTSQVASMISIAMIGLGLIVVVVGVMRVFSSSMRGYGPSGWPLIIGGVVISGAAFVLPMVFRGLGGPEAFQHRVSDAQCDAFGDAEP